MLNSSWAICHVYVELKTKVSEIPSVPIINIDVGRDDGNGRYRRNIGF
jgi:hypothetical protein